MLQDVLTYVVSRIWIESDNHTRCHSSRDDDPWHNTPCREYNHHSNFCGSFDVWKEIKGIPA